MRARLLAAAVSIVALPFALVGAAQRTPPPVRGDWPSYRGNLAGTGYSALTAIDRSTVTRLQRAWTFPLGAASGAQTSGGTTAAVNSQATPIVIGGSMYLPTADAVVALDTATGRPIWRTPVTGGAPSRRGVWYWPGDGTIAARIFVMSGRRLMALEARDGTPAAVVRKWRNRRYRRPIQLGPRHLPQRHCRGRQQPAWHCRRHRQSSRLRCAHRREVVGVQLSGTAGSSGPRHLGRGELEGALRRKRLAVLLHVRRGARPSLCAACVTDSGRLRRRSQGRQPVRQLRRCARCADRRLQVALPDDPPRPLGSRSARAAGAVRCGSQRSNHSRARADHQVRLSVHPQSRDRCAGLRRRGTSNAGERGSGRARVSHAADSGEAAGACASRLFAVRSRHRGRHDARACARVRRPALDAWRRVERRAIHAVGHEADAPLSWHARGCELGRRRVRSDERLHHRRNAGCGCHRPDGASQGWFVRALREGVARPLDVRRAHGRFKLALPEAAVGTARLL